MRKIIEDNGWTHYKTGCSCSGSPKYFKHDNHKEIIILRQTSFKIQRDGAVVATGNSENIMQILKTNGLIQMD